MLLLHQDSLLVVMKFFQLSTLLPAGLGLRFRIECVSD
jgi:hypothetical protein